MPRQKLIIDKNLNLCTMTKSHKASSEGKKAIKMAREGKGWPVIVKPCRNDECLEIASKYISKGAWEKTTYLDLSGATRVRYADGINESSWRRFVDANERMDAKVFEVYCEILDLKVDDVVEKKADIVGKFRSLIDDKTQDFVGREYIFKAINNFIANNKNGYFAITGDPGQGKSAILAKYVQDTNCIVHFNSSLQGPNRTDQFLESICDQLINRYQLPYDLLPPNATRDGEFLLDLLEESAEKRNGQSIIIAVDALDEVDRGSNRDSVANILFLPPYLPANVYFILTKRRGVDVPFTVDTPFDVLSLLDDQYQSDSERDVIRNPVLIPP
jgi:hypothetical protein